MDDICTLSLMWHILNKNRFTENVIAHQIKDDFVVLFDHIFYVPFDMKVRISTALFTLQG